MLDKILLKSRFEAHMIFQDGRVVVLSSDKNVLDIIEIILMPSHVIRECQFIDSSGENTQSIEVNHAA
jgi:hypothetical protein